jgi:hypothetical protein
MLNLNATHCVHRNFCMILANLLMVQTRQLILSLATNAAICSQRAVNFSIKTNLHDNYNLTLEETHKK